MEVVSTIIPCYNSELHLQETITSILSQTGAFATEIICVDNGSTDGTLELLDRLKSDHPNLIVAEEKEKGASFARSKGLSLAKGDYIQFLDSDDVILPYKFEKQIEAIKNNNLDWVVSDRAVMNHDLSEVIAEYQYQHFLENKLEVAISEVITSGNPLYKKNALIRVGGYTPRLTVGQDWDLHIKLVLADLKVGYLAGDFFHSRRLEGSLSSNWINVSNVLCDLIAQYKESFIDKGVQHMSKAMDKIHQTYLLSIIHSQDENKGWMEELVFWSKQAKLSQKSLGKLGLVYRIAGLKVYVGLRKMLKR